MGDQPDRSTAEPLEFRDVTKRYPGTSSAAVDGLSLEVPAGRDLRPRRPVGLRQDDRDADGQPDDRDHLRRHPARRAQRQGPQGRPSCAARSATSSSTSACFRTRRSARTSRPCPACSAGTRQRTSRARRGADRAHRPAARDAHALPQPAVRRPAPARRRGPRARRRPAGHADGRAVRRDRPDQPRAPAERVPAPAGRAAQDDHLRHARHRRGDQDGRPDRRSCRGRQARPVRAAGGAADGARRVASSRTSSAPTARSSALRCSACATSTCGRWQRAARASRSPPCASASPSADLDIPLLVDDEHKPIGWLSERGLTGERVRRSCAPGPTRSSSSTTSCATRSRTCSPPSRCTAPVVDARGHVVGALSIQAISHAIGHARDDVLSAAERVGADPGAEPAGAAEDS